MRKQTAEMAKLVAALGETGVADADRSSHAREPFADQTDVRLSSLGSEPSVGQSGIVIGSHSYQ